MAYLIDTNQKQAKHMFYQFFCQHIVLITRTERNILVNMVSIILVDEVQSLVRSMIQANFYQKNLGLKLRCIPQFVSPTSINFNSLPKLPQTIALIADQLKISSIVKKEAKSEIVNIFLNKKYEHSEILTLSKIYLIIGLEVAVSGASD